MTTSSRKITSSSKTGRHVKVSRSTVAAAKGRILVAKKLGTKVPKATWKIAQASKVVNPR